MSQDDFNIHLHENWSNPYDCKLATSIAERSIKNLNIFIARNIL